MTEPPAPFLNYWLNEKNVLGSNPTNATGFLSVAIFCERERQEKTPKGFGEEKCDFANNQ